MSHYKQILLFIALCGALCCTAITQEVRELDVSTVSPTAGWHPYYEMKVDPENPANIIVCGIRGNAKDNAFYGFVYSSVDGGKTWSQALEDKNSTFESEQSCAFGVHGLAYYVASASKVIDGLPHHEQGTTRIYVSNNSGRSWKLSVMTGWTDYSTAIVDTYPGPNQNRLYVFFNNLQTFYDSVGNKKAVESEKANSSGTRVGMISFKDGDPTVAGPFSSDEMSKQAYHGSYPSPAIVLKDGVILTFFYAGRRTNNNQREHMVAVVRTKADRSGLETPIKVVDSFDDADDNLNIPCGGYALDSAGAYDAQHNKLYFAYSRIDNKKCHLFLTTSTDGGRSWSKAYQLSTSDAAVDRSYSHLGIAVQTDGTLGLIWQDELRSGCWQFATSSDSGQTLTHAQQLGICSEILTPSALSTAYLWTSFFQTDPRQSIPAMRIVLRDTWNNIWRNQDAVVSAQDGGFRVIWSDADNGAGELRTAAIHFEPAEKLISRAVNGLKDVTTRMTLLYGGDQSYDPKTRILTLSVKIRNDGNQPVNGPLKFAVQRINDHNGVAEIANADNGVSGAGAVWDISFALPGGALPPGETSRSFVLKFHYLAEPDTPRGSADDILALNIIKIYAKL